jgi:uncharacterized protein YqjF (DUF2071 family)
MSRPFLTAEWRNLFLVSYAVPPALLENRLPPGLTLDLRDGNAFVSLVAFEFLKTAPQFPFLRSIVPRTALGNFPELNLRFYVRQGAERGVVFIREYVPQRLVAWVARRLYNEHYLAAPLTAARTDLPDEIRLHYRLAWAGRDHHLHVSGAKPCIRPAPDSLEHFFKEHQWGFGVTRSGQGIRYEVAHPVWDVYPVREFRLDFDFGSVYGPEWSFLSDAAPISTVLAAGSDIAVYPKGTIA